MMEGWLLGGKALFLGAFCASRGSVRWPTPGLFVNCAEDVRTLDCGRTQASSPEPIVQGLLLGLSLRIRRFGNGWLSKPPMPSLNG